MLFLVKCERAFNNLVGGERFAQCWSFSTDREVEHPSRFFFECYWH